MLYTLAGLATYQEEIKKSRFLAVAGPVRSPNEALQFFAAHSVVAASHNCWAYRIGAEYRYTDDGEPGGTAGRPVLQAIETQQCNGVAVLVTRWFGGIKLGPGGLIRAYGGTAAQCLRQAAKLEIVDEVYVDCRCAFGDKAIVQSRLAGFQARIQDEHFDGQGVTWCLAIPRRCLEPLAVLFADLTRGQGHWQVRRPDGL
jgi:uncharacterized YigZ family protein